MDRFPERDRASLRGEPDEQREQAHHQLVVLDQLLDPQERAPGEMIRHRLMAKRQEERKHRQLNHKIRHMKAALALFSAVVHTLSP